MTLQEAIDLFIGGYKPSTRETYGYPLAYLRDMLGAARPMKDITPAHLTAYFQTRKSKPATLRRYIKTCKTFFNWAVRLRIIEQSPAEPIKTTKIPHAVDRSKAITDEEVGLLLKACKDSPRDYALVLFLLDTGCRRGGATGLRVGDIDWFRSEANVTEKGDKKRKVLFGEDCRTAIIRWLEFRSVRYKVTGIYVFSFDGEPFLARNISAAFRKACKTAGIRNLGPHSARHRKGHQLADEKVAPTIAATALGHESERTTLAFYYPRDWDTAAAELRKLTTNSRQLMPPNIVKFGR
jgi:integrase